MFMLVAGAAGIAGGLYYLGEANRQILSIVYLELNPIPTAVSTATVVLGMGSLLVMGGRAMRAITPEHREAERQRKLKFRKLPIRVRNKIIMPPMVGWLALALPYGAVWLTGIPQYSYPEWMGTEVPVAPWMYSLMALTDKIGNPWLNGLGFTMVLGMVVIIIWSWFARGWEQRVLEGGAVVGARLPDPGAYQHTPKTFRKEAEWQDWPTFVLGARESAASRAFEPNCEIPSWVSFEGTPIFGGLIVFGQKGAGKTALLTRMLEDAMTFRADELDHRCSIMVLDPKGDMVGPVMASAKRHGRAGDIVKLGVGTDVKWNPFAHLKPHTSARSIRQAGYFLRCAMPSGGGENTYWEDNATNLLSYSMQLLAYANMTVSFDSLAKLVTRLKSEKDKDFRAELYDAAEKNLRALPTEGIDARIAELDNVKLYFEEEFIHLAEKPRSIIVNTATNFLRKFEGAEYKASFCGNAEDEQQFVGFETLIDKGLISVLDIRATEDGEVAAALCCLCKLFYQAAVLTRDRRAEKTPEGKPIYKRACVSIWDEYQQYVTVGSARSFGDPQYLETSRSFKAVDIAATQQLSSIAAAAGGRDDAAQRVTGSFNGVVSFRHNDEKLTRYLASLVGKRELAETSESVAEGTSKAKSHMLMTQAVLGTDQSVSRTVSTRNSLKDIVSAELFADFQVFEALAVFSSAERRESVRFYSKPHWIDDVRTPQSEVLKKVK